MPKPWRLAPTAEESLIDIALWTSEFLGPRQADVHEEYLIVRCAEIAAGTAHARDCRKLIDSSLPEDMRLARAGEHFIFVRRRCWRDRYC